MTTVLRPDALAAMYAIKTHYVYKVIEFHPDTQTVDIIQDTYEYTFAPISDTVMENELGRAVTVTARYPDVLVGVPVKQFRFGQFEIQACPAPGDTGYIEVFTNDIRNWIKNGEQTQWSDKHFMKHSAVFVPFMPNNKNCVDDYPANPDGSADLTKFVIKSKNSRITITDVIPKEGTEAQPQTTIQIATTNTSITMNDNNGEGGIEAKGNLTVNGDLNVVGNISATGDVAATGDVTAANGTISLMKHTHLFAYSAGPTPAEGATNPPTTGA